jgi:hypothetical protein
VDGKLKGMETKGVIEKVNYVMERKIDGYNE